MILVVDIGNTRIKWAYSRNGVLEKVDGALLETPGEGGAWQTKWLAIEHPRRIVVANVAGQAIAEQLQCWTQRVWGLVPEFVRSSERFGEVVNGYHEPERLGVDRWAALVAARRITSDPTVVVSCGTAVTVDVMSGRGEHLGGLIIPGLGLMRDALSRGTRQIERIVEHVDVREILGHSTEECINIGTVQAVAALVERTADAITAAPGETPSLLLCGGDAARILPWLTGRSRYEPHLVLHGLAIMASAPQGT